MEFKRLKYFIAVAEELHFGRAAGRLDMAQPPLSRQIAQLEIEVGAQLFDRSRSKIRLTQAGELLLDRSKAILSHLEDTYAETRRLGEGAMGLLRVAFVGTATYGAMPTIIKSFRSNFPDIDISLLALNNADLMRALIQGEIDVAVARPGLDDDELKTERLQTEPLTLALPDTMLANLRDPVPLESMRNETFVLYPRSPRPSFADHILDVCNKAGFHPGKIVEAMDFQTAISLVAVGVGVSIVPHSVSLAKRPGVSYRPYQGFNPGTALSINYRRDNRSPQLLNFLEITRRYARTSTAPGV